MSTVMEVINKKLAAYFIETYGHLIPLSYFGQLLYQAGLSMIGWGRELLFLLVR